MLFPYLIPVSFTANGEIPLEYRLTVRKRDMRTTWCKKHEIHRLNSMSSVMDLPEFAALRKITVVDDSGSIYYRYIAPDGKTAVAFAAAIEAIYGYLILRDT